ncbi:cytochrome C oxidase subunit IV family protein [Rubeoparvulum massiliense]|uniref:cytochrome C oxidase subunit IV family protein n=1 Tax=Rubeoparvulum massiliense TaxID=1631346 RepID=UPI00065DBF83|nr:cytochrome C oxidase subunit IV family protein [Rubeoparvulum massiliense]
MEGQMNQSIAEQRQKREIKEATMKHLWTFILSIFLTVIAFVAVEQGLMSTFALMVFLIALAIIQASFQLYIWMHLEQKDHEHSFGAAFMFSGFFVALVTIIVLVYLIWW